MACGSKFHFSISFASSSPALSSIFEWNGPLTFNRTALFAPAAFKDSAAFSTAAVFPVITICPGQL